MVSNFIQKLPHTQNGKKLLKNFIFSICKSKKNWSSKFQKKFLLTTLKIMLDHPKSFAHYQEVLIVV